MNARSKEIFAWSKRTLSRLFRFLFLPFTSLCSLVASTWRYFCGDEYSGTFANADKVHTSKVAAKFFARGQQFMVLSGLMLCGVIALVSVGVLTFLFPTKFTDVAATEVDSEISSRKYKIEQLMKDEKTRASRLSLAREYHESLAPFFEIYTDLSYAQQTEDEDKYRPGPPLTDALGLLSAINTGAENFTLKFSSSYAHSGLRGEQRLAKETLAHLRAKFSDATPGITNMSKALERIQEDHNVQERKAAVSAAVVLLGWVKDEFQRSKEHQSSLNEEASDFSATASQNREQIQLLNTEIAELIAKRTLAEASRQSWEIWLPVFSIRLAVVILVLFLTRILLETYRYTVAIASFYRARGDAIQMVEIRNSEQPIDVDSYGKMVAFLAPDAYRIDPVAGPEDTLLKIVDPKK